MPGESASNEADSRMVQIVGFPDFNLFLRSIHFHSEFLTDEVPVFQKLSDVFLSFPRTMNQRSFANVPDSVSFHSVRLPELTSLQVTPL